MNSRKFPINPIIPLAYNMADCSQKYVLFIGAGVSKDANVPSGWDILLDTLKRIRQQEEKTIKNYTNDAMEKYYKEKYEKYSYADIISALFPSNEEQRDYLKSQFKGITPGEAHELIAELVKKEIIKYIITTNFDTLLEDALDNIGLKSKYTVISSNDEVKTSKPWNKEEICRIYKIHGTIEKGKIYNAKEDLQELPEDLAKDFLDIIERHGVIVLGYAAHEDEKAIFNIFRNRKFKGYTLYWTSFNDNLSKNANELVRSQDGVIITINGAFSFLKELLGRIELAQRGIEQTLEAVAEVRFESIVKNPKGDVELLQTIEREQKKLIKYIEEAISNINTTNVDSIYDTFLKTFKFSYNYLLLAEQIAKYKNEYWVNILTIFEKISSLNKTGDRDSTNGIINYLFFCVLEVLGAILVEYNKFSLLRQMLKTKRFNERRNDMENILSWPIHAHFIKLKNEHEQQKWIVPMFHYLLGIVQSQDIPFEFNIKKRLIEADLIFFIFSVKVPGDSIHQYWFPRSPIYSEYDTPELFKKIKYDNEFGDIFARELFEINYQELLKLLSQANNIIHTKFARTYFDSISAVDVLNIFLSE